mgnify:CR=1 FL=1
MDFIHIRKTYINNFTRIPFSLDIMNFNSKQKQKRSVKIKITFKRRLLKEIQRAKHKAIIQRMKLLADLLLRRMHPMRLSYLLPLANQEEMNS